MCEYRNKFRINVNSYAGINTIVTKHRDVRSREVEADLIGLAQPIVARDSEDPCRTAQAVRGGSDFSFFSKRFMRM